MKQYQLSGDLFLKSEEYKKATTEYSKWANVEPDNYKPFVSLSVAYYLQKEYEKATECLMKAFETDTVLSKEAVVFYEELLSMDNFIWNVFYNGAEAFILDNQLATAAKIIQEAEKVDNNEKKAMAFVLHGRIHIEKEEEDKALQFFLKANELDRDNVNAYVYLGEAYSNLAEPSKAITYLKKAINIDAGNFTACNLLGEIYMETKKYDLAVEMFEKTSSLTEDNAAVLYKLAHAYLQKEDYPRTKNVAEKILDLPEIDEATAAEAYILIGILGFNNEKYTESIEALNKAIEANPDNCDSYQLLAHSYHKIGKDSIAKEFSRKWESCVEK
jgi:tetratricopeptide (TPR) repeat protein